MLNILDCQEHGFDCKYLLYNQADFVGYRYSNKEMFESCDHKCAMVRLFARIGLLRRRSAGTDLKFYSEFRQVVETNIDFYLRSSPRTIISILSTIADYDTKDSTAATMALLLSRFEEIKNTCFVFNEWEAHQEQFQKACESSEWQHLGIGHKKCDSLFILFRKISRSIKPSPLVHKFTLQLYDNLFDPKTGYPYSPSMVRPNCRQPNWIDMIAKQTGRKDLSEKLRTILCS